MQHNIRSIICVLVSCFCLSGCSLGFIYNNLSWLSSWYVDDYVSFSAKQQQQFNDDFKAFQHWHRTTQLALYTNQLERFKRQLIEGITEEQINSHRDLLQAHWHNLIMHAKPQLVDLTYSLDLTQRSMLLESIKEKNQERYNDSQYKNIESWHQERCDAQKDFYNKWLGRLTNLQKQKICDYVKATSPLAAFRFEYSNTWFTNIESALLLTKGRAEFEVMLTDTITNAGALKTEQYRILSENNAQVYIRLFLVMMESINSSQKQHIIDELNELIDTLKTLEFDR